MIHNKFISSVLTAVSVLALGCLTASVTSCVKEEVKVQSVNVSQTAIVLTQGETAMISYTIEPSNAANKTVSFTSSDPGVATVDGAGLVTAVAPGKTTITVASKDGPSATVLVSVQAKAVAVTGVELDKTELTILEGETATLKATVSPADASDKSVTWKSSNESIATVADGVVTGVKAGSAAITVTTNDGGKTATCVVTVESATVAVTGVSLDKTELTLTEGDTATLKATVTPEDATDKEVTWTSSQPSVATVSDGVIIAVAPGSTAITVTTNDGNKTATCAVTVVAKTIAVTGVSLDKTELTLVEGDTATLTATVTPADASDKSVTWKSSQPSVATVTDGVIIALAPGKTAITVTTVDGGKTATCAVTVEAKVVEVSEVKVDVSDVTLTEGGTSKITVTIEPADATDKTVTFTSSDESVATVDADGNITAVGPGTATITVTAGGKTATVTVTVTAAPVAVTGVSLNHTELNLLVGGEATLVATVTPDDATNKEVSWISTTPTVAEVDDHGKVTAKALGSATIVVTTKDGGFTASCDVTVGTTEVAVTGVSLNKSSLSLVVGSSETLVATVLPAEATNKAVTWSSSTPTVAEVDDNGKVTAKKAGSATITVTTKDGGHTASCDVTVTTAAVAVTGISVVPATLTLTEGESETLTATVLPSNATNKDVTWSSSSAAVATVDANGKVTAVKAGSATITATTVDGGKTATCSVTVKAGTVAVTGVTVSPTSLTLTEGETSTLTATVSPSNASNKTVKWESSKTSVATVDANGKVTAVKEGTATITVTTNDGGKKATCSVTVKAGKVAVTGVTMSPTSLSLVVGETSTLTATVKPDNATDKTVKWSSNKTGVATVDANGKVTAKAEGTATITVTTNDGGKTASCAVTVVAATVEFKWNTKDFIAPSGEGSGPWAETNPFYCEHGKSFTMIAWDMVNDRKYTTDESKVIKWTTSDSSIASISAGTGYETTVTLSNTKAGIACITATDSFGGKRTCYVTNGYKFTSSDIAIGSGDGYDPGTSSAPHYKKVGATNKVQIWHKDGDKDQVKSVNASYIKWSSNNTSYITVSPTTGYETTATFKAAGLTYVVATDNWGETRTCYYQVYAPITAITGNSTPFYVGAGVSDAKDKTVQMEAGTDYTVTPSSGSMSDPKFFTWSSSNTSYATVGSSTGLVTIQSGLYGGDGREAIISANPKYGSIGTKQIRAFRCCYWEYVCSYSESTSSGSIQKNASFTSTGTNYFTMDIGKEVFLILRTQSASTWGSIRFGNGTFTFENSDASVAQVDHRPSGSNDNYVRFTGKKVGTTTVKVKLIDHNTYFATTFEVKVVDPSKMFKWSDGDVAVPSGGGVTAWTTSKPYPMGAGKTCLMQAWNSSSQYKTEAAKSITWKSSDTSLATLSTTTGYETTVTASSTKTGLVTITGTDSYGNTRTCVIAVFKITGNSTPFKISTGTSYTKTLTAGKDYTIESPSAFTPTIGDWKSSSTSVATVNSSGVVTVTNGTSAGSAKITAGSTNAKQNLTDVAIRTIQKCGWTMKCIYTWDQVSENTPTVGKTYGNWNNDEIFIDADSGFRVRFVLDGNELKGNYYKVTKNSNKSAIPYAEPSSVSGEYYVFIESTSLSNTGSSTITIKYESDNEYVEKTFKVTIIDAFKFQTADIVIPSGKGYTPGTSTNPMYIEHGTSGVMQIWNTSDHNRNPKEEASTVKWTTSDSSIASISSTTDYETTFTMSSTKAGIACITGTDRFGNSRSCYVTNGYKFDSNDIAIGDGEGVNPGTSSSPMYYKVGSSDDMIIYKKGSGDVTVANAKFITWSSKNTSYITVSPTQGYETTASFKAAGKTEIVATDNWGNTRSNWVQVYTSLSSTSVPFKVAVNNKSGNVTYQMNKYADMIFDPSSATVDPSRFTWSSSNTSVATVSETGLVTIPNSTNTSSAVVTGKLTYGSREKISRTFQLILWGMKAIRADSKTGITVGATFDNWDQTVNIKGAGNLRLRFYDASNSVDLKGVDSYTFTTTASSSDFACGIDNYNEDGYYLYITTYSAASGKTAKITLTYSNNAYYVTKTFNVKADF